MLYAVGPEDSVSNLEQVFMNTFQPTYFTKSFGPDTPDGTVYYVVQIEISTAEVAAALGISPRSPELIEILDRLAAQGKEARDPQGSQDFINSGTPSGSPVTPPKSTFGWFGNPTNGYSWGLNGN